MNASQALLQELRAGVFLAKNSGLQDRLALLKRFREGFEKSRGRFVEALSRDFEKPEFESLLTEIMPVLEELKLFEKNLAAWMRPEQVPGSLTLAGAHAEIRHGAKGLVLVISPWNYPLCLALVPVIGALATGNVVVLKPSELTPHVSAALREFAEEFLPPDRIRVLEGGKELSEELLAEAFDHIFFTGSTEVGRIVMRAAAEHLTPVTLELGGKSPTVIGRGYPLDHAAERIVWGKVVNSGQTCIAPDYVFVHEADAAAFLAEAQSFIDRMQPDEGKASASIISSRHADRLWKMLAEAGVEAKSPVDPRKMKLQLIPRPTTGSKIMQEEIFGPILPVLTYRDLSEVEHFIAARPRPLALYIFSQDRAEQKRLLDNTHSGGVCINDTLIHLGTHHLPFGGTGASGLGNYHGHASFRTFTQQRSVLRQGPFKKIMSLLKPPYTEVQLKWIRRGADWF